MKNLLLYETNQYVINLLINFNLNGELVKRFALIILDGFGLRDEIHANAIKLAHTPTIDKLFETCPWIPIETSGKFVGLPNGVMGNSEVGHTNIGAGRIVKQDLVRINDDVASDKLNDNNKLKNTLSIVKNNNSTLHLIGLLSDAGVHSHIDHLKYLIHSAKNYGIQDISIHVITDGRDTSPNSGLNYVKHIQIFLDEIGIGKIATISGRFYSMDRDKRWERTESSYRCYMFGEGKNESNAITAIENNYLSKITDEFIPPTIIGKGGVIKNGDGVIAFNFRADRMRQISKAFTDNTFDKFQTKQVDFHYLSMTQYQESFTFPFMYKPEVLTNILPEVLENSGYTQLRAAETEKYAHVTYFLNGGDEKQFKNEHRILVPSPKVKTYDLQPEMSAKLLTEKLIKAIQSGKYPSIFVNFANPDMVGHTGDLNAAIKAVETIDSCLEKMVFELEKSNTTLFLTADHGNLEMMIDPKTNNPHTAHTTNPVPLLLKSQDKSISIQGAGKLADIAPTILEFLNIHIPKEMNGESKLTRN